MKFIINDRDYRTFNEVSEKFGVTENTLRNAQCEIMLFPVKVTHPVTKTELTVYSSIEL